MHQQLFPRAHNFLLPLLKIPKFLYPISHFHSSNQNPISQSTLQSLNPQESAAAEEEREDISTRKGSLKPSSIEPKLQITHPWPEWIDLMEHLLKKGYFEGGNGHPFGREAMGTKDTNQIRTTLLNFARDRFDIIRYFSRKDLSAVLGYGCPSLDRKVVNSGKRLRAHVGLVEGNVCGSCSLRGNCERAYVQAREDEGGRTVDVMRILLTYGLDPITGSVENTPCLNKNVKESVRKLLSEMVEYSTTEPDSNSPKAVPSKRHSFLSEHSSQEQKGEMDVPMKQGDWICPKCNFLNFARNIKCLRCDGLFEERLRKFGENQDHLPLKKGDWLCGKCNFLNFAKNTKCLQCKEKPPKRQLNPGEWECPSCNYINFKRNMLCLKCDWKRPKASNYSDISAQNQVENKGSNQPYGMNFVRDDDECNSWSSVRQEHRKESERSWTNLDEDKDEDASRFRSWNNRLDDFPISKGKSDISQNPQARERWKKEISKRSRSVSKEREGDNDLDSQLPPDFEESNDDEEIAGWFGRKKNI